MRKIKVDSRRLLKSFKKFDKNLEEMKTEQSARVLVLMKEMAENAVKGKPVIRIEDLQNLFDSIVKNRVRLSSDKDAIIGCARINLMIAVQLSNDKKYTESINTEFEKNKNLYNSEDVLSDIQYSMFNDFGFDNIFSKSAFSSGIKILKMLVHSFNVACGETTWKESPYSDLLRVVKPSNKKMIARLEQSARALKPLNFTAYRKEVDKVPFEDVFKDYTASDIMEYSAISSIVFLANCHEYLMEYGLMLVLETNAADFMFDLITSDRLITEDENARFEAFYDSNIQKFIDKGYSNKQAIGLLSHRVLGYNIANSKEWLDIVHPEPIVVNGEEKKSTISLNIDNAISEASSVLMYPMLNRIDLKSRVEEIDIVKYIYYFVLGQGIYNDTGMRFIDPNEIEESHYALLSTNALKTAFSESMVRKEHNVNHAELEIENMSIKNELQKTKEALDAANKKLDAIESNHNKELNNLKREHDKALKLKQREINNLGKQVDEFESMVNEVTALRELAREVSKPTDIDSKFDVEKALETINKRPVVMVGGYEKWVKKVKKYIPDMKHLSVDELGRSYAAVSNPNAIVLYQAAYNNHGAYDKFVNHLNKDATLVYLDSSSNIERLIERIYDNIKQ